MSEKITDIIKAILSAENIVLEDIKYKNGTPSRIKILCDTATGIQSSHLAKITKRILNNEEFIDAGGDDYTLEISSPGIDFPLTEARHFIRNIPRDVELEHSTENLKNPLTGTISSATDTMVTLIPKDKKLGAEIGFSYEEIKSGKIKIKW